MKCSHCGKSGHAAKDCWAKISANDLELPQHLSLEQSPRQSLLQRAKAAKAAKAGAKVEGKEESFEKLKKVKSLKRLRSLKNQKLSRMVETRLLW